MNRRSARAQAKLLRGVAAPPSASSVEVQQLVASFAKVASSSSAGAHSAVRVEWGASSGSASVASSLGKDMGGGAVRSAAASLSPSLVVLDGACDVPRGGDVVRSTASGSDCEYTTKEDFAATHASASAWGAVVVCSAAVVTLALLLLCDVRHGRRCCLGRYMGRSCCLLNRCRRVCGDTRCAVAVRSATAAARALHVFGNCR